MGAGPLHVVVMGVSGSGKSVLGECLAARLGRPFAEGDDFHSAANIAKMSAGVPLTDADRAPWLAALRDWMDGQPGPGTVITCSALRRAYRDVLRGARGRVVFLQVSADPGAIRERMARRAGHFMPASLLTSQLDALEPLADDEDGRVLANTDTVPDLVDRAVAVVAEMER